MRKHTIRTLAVGVGAGALVLGMAAPAMAAAADPVNQLPAKVKLGNSDTVDVTLTVPGSCDTANWTWTTRTVGQKFGVASVTPIGCDGPSGAQTWTVTAADLGAPDAKKKKANAVVKFILTPTADYVAANPDAARSVKSLVVKVNAKTGKPTTNPGQAKKAQATS